MPPPRISLALTKTVAMCLGSMMVRAPTSFPGEGRGDPVGARRGCRSTHRRLCPLDGRRLTSIPLSGNQRVYLHRGAHDTLWGECIAAFVCCFKLLGTSASHHPFRRVSPHLSSRIGFLHTAVALSHVEILLNWQVIFLSGFLLGLFLSGRSVLESGLYALVCVHAYARAYVRPRNEGPPKGMAA